MYKKWLNGLVLITVLTSCDGVKPHISVVCEENRIGNSIVKWETAPLIQGNVKVYASTDPEEISEETPVAVANIADQHMTIVTNDPGKRFYYKLVFNDKYQVKTAARNINIPGLQNFRDLGGYPSYSTHKQIRWGMLYRSAEINQLKDFSVKKLKALGIKTIIDLRTHDELAEKELVQDEFNIVHVPFFAGNLDNLLKDIQHHTLAKDTLYKVVEEYDRQLIRNYKKEFKRIFEVLLDKDNYPVVIHCVAGKERTGVVSALILAALQIDDEAIMNDYQLSNTYFNIPQASKYAYNLPTNLQEAITTFCSARESFLMAAKDEIERHYGDVATYLQKGIGLKKDDIKRLQSILLEKP